MEKLHKKLHVWKEAMELARLTYEVTAELPTAEKYGLIAQMRKAAVSIPSNISEGAARQGRKDSIHFFVIARGSLSELDTQVELLRLLRLADPEQISKLQTQLDKSDALLNGLIRYRRSKQAE